MGSTTVLFHYVKCTTRHISGTAHSENSAMANMRTPARTGTTTTLSTQFNWISAKVAPERIALAFSTESISSDLASLRASKLAMMKSQLP